MARYIANTAPMTAYYLPAADRSSAKPRSFLQSAFFGPLGFLRGVFQGAASGALTFLGAMRLSADAGVGVVGAAPVTFETFTQRIMAGGAPGMVELAAAAALFLTAGRGWGRVLGLLGVVAMVAAYANGAAPEDLLPYVEGLYAKISQIMTQFGAAGLLAA